MVAEKQQRGGQEGWPTVGKKRYRRKTEDTGIYIKGPTGLVIMEWVEPSLVTEG
jgi:hypothetical protein